MAQNKDIATITWTKEMDILPLRAWLSFNVMAKVCEIMGKRTLFGNRVSKANNKTRRKFKPNLQKKTFFLPEVKAYIDLKVSTKALRTINKNGLYATMKKALKQGTLAPKYNHLVAAL